MTPRETPKSSNKLSLRWTGSDREYLGTNGMGPEIIVDGRSAAGPSPMALLLYSLAGCMAIDVQHVLGASRVPMTGLEVDVEGERAADPPRFYTKIRMDFRVEGPEDAHQAKLDRALALSKEKYCSVLHSLRPDMDIEIRVRRV
jgi:putative redox protein